MKKIGICKICNKQFNGFTGLSDFEKATHYIFSGLEKMGLDLEDENFKGTPKRLARALYEIFNGVTDTEDRIKAILSTAFPSEGYDALVLSNDILTYSMCPHHLLPVKYNISLGYIPSDNGRVLGISKLGRICEILSARPVLQEQLAVDIIKALESINPVGSMVIIRGEHLCMQMRGVKQRNANVITSKMSGVFKEDIKSRQEFLDLIKIGG